MSEQKTFSFRPLPVEPAPPSMPATRPNLVIEAGAGTGKTTRIVKEVVQLLLRDPAIVLERIVLMTFTEKAAGEIADRIRAAMTDLATTLDSPEPRWPSDRSGPAIIVVRPDEIETARVACAAHLPQIDRLRSQTIHSFCQNLLRLYPIEAGLTPQFRITEGYELGKILHEIYGEWLESELSPDAGDERIDEWRAIYRQFLGIDRFEETLKKLRGAADLIRDESLTLGDTDLVDGLIREVLGGIRSLPESDVRAINDDGQMEIVRYTRATALPPEANVDGWIAWFAPIESAINRMDLRKGSKQGPLKSLLKSLRADKKTLPARLRGHRVAEVLRSVGLRHLDFVEKKKDERGVVDFDDLLVRTARLLDDARILTEIRERYDFIFVDEFQDTDRIQARIVDRLARDRRGLFVPGKVTLVGDPKQSIYAFRSADPETYRDTLEAFSTGNAKREILDVQHRSDPVLLDALNTMFAKLFEGEGDADPNVFTPRYSPLTAARGSMLPDGEPRVRFLLTPAAEDSKSLDVEAEALASWIAARRDGTPGELRRIAILMRRGTHFQLFADALERRGIPAVMPPAGSFLEQPAVVDLTAVLRAIAHGFDRAAQISAARTPYFALTDDEIFGHFFSCARDGDDRCPYVRFLETTRTWRRHSRSSTVLRLVERVLEESPIEALGEVSHDGALARAHLERVLEMAAMFDEETGGSLAEFVDELAARRDQDAESEPSINDETADVVRIMTIHGAKGLEFETVILPDLSFGGGSGDLSIFATNVPRHLVFSGPVESFSAWAARTPAGGELREVRSGRDRAEERRLFYVAATRAKAELVFVVTEDSKSGAGFMKHLHHIFGRAAFESCLTTRGTPEWMTLSVGLDGAVEAWFERAAVDGGGEAAARIRDERAASLVARLSGIAPLPEAAAGVEPEIEAVLDRSEAARRTAAGASRVAGILLHRILEVWDGEPGSLDALVERLALEIGAEAHETDAARKRLTTIQSSPVLARLQRMDTVGRELTVHYMDEDRAREGRIDRLLRDGGRLVVLDYKSGKPDPDRVARDSEQVRRYCRLVREATGSEVAGLLWYVDVDTDEAVPVEA